MRFPEHLCVDDVGRETERNHEHPGQERQDGDVVEHQAEKAVDIAEANQWYLRSAAMPAPWSGVACESCAQRLRAGGDARDAEGVPIQQPSTGLASALPPA